MVKCVQHHQSNVWLCEICHLAYPLEELACACEEWCSKSNICNIELVRKAILK